MKVIFLDIDGVLNSHRTCMAFKGFPAPSDNPKRGWDKLDPIAIKLLQRVCERSNAVCVLSSTWRLGVDRKWLDKLQKYLGVSIIDKTREAYDKRGYQIKDWLDSHPEVTHYAILDDDSDMLEDQMGNFVKTTHEDGLSYQNHVDLIEILDGKMFSD